MGASSSKTIGANSIIVEKGSGLSGDVRRNNNDKYKNALVASAFDDVATLYDGFQ